MTVTDCLPDQADLSPVEQLVYIVLADEGPLRTAEVDDRLPLLSRRAVRRGLRQLVDKGVATCRHDPADARAKIYDTVDE